MPDVDQIDSEDEGLAFGYSADDAETNIKPDPLTEENDDTKNVEGKASSASEPEPEPEPGPEPQPEPEPESKPNENSAEDPLEKIRNQFDGRLRNMQGEINKLTKQLSQSNGAAATAAAKEQGADAPSATQVREAMADGEKLAALREEFPEWAEALDEQISLVEQRVLSKVPAADTSGLATKDEIEEFRQKLPVLIKHPTFEKDIRSEVFSKWFDAQPVDVQALADSEEPSDAIALMDKFYERTPSLKKDPQKRLADAVAPQTGANKPQPRAQSEDDGMRLGYNSV